MSVLKPIPGAPVVGVAPIKVETITALKPLTNGSIMITEAPVYEGPDRITPSAEPQILKTDGFGMVGDIIVDPIPKNYGLITYNGFSLKIT